MPLLLAVLVGCDHHTLAALIPGVASPPEPSALVWQGFTHAWTTNHRVNALGDTIVPIACDTEGCEAELGHTAASGSGSDTATFTSGYAAVFSPDVEFRHGWSECTVQHVSGEGLPFACEMDAQAEIEPGETAVALLEGFEIESMVDPDKLERLAIDLGPVTVEDDRARFDVDVETTLDCDSLECDGADKLNTDQSYVITVRWVVVSGDLASLDLRSREDYAWDATTELEAEDFRRSSTVPAEGPAFVGIRGFSVRLDDEHHLAELYLRAEQDEMAQGELPVTTTGLFKQWNATTLDNPLSYTDSGLASFRFDTTVVELGSGCVVTGERAGTQTWEADGGPAGGEATSYDIVRVEACDG
jgi:hypothetical protein